LVVAGRDSAVDFEVSDHALDPVALAVERFVVAELPLSVGFRRNGRFDPSSPEIGPDQSRVVRLVGNEPLRGLLGQVDQPFVGFAVGRLPGREEERERAAFGISETVNFTGEPAPRAAKTSLMNPPFPRAAEM
jgi:hypothetical protein